MNDKKVSAEEAQDLVAKELNKRKAANEKKLAIRNNPEEVDRNYQKAKEEDARAKSELGKNSSGDASQEREAAKEAAAKKTETAKDKAESDNFQEQPEEKKRSDIEKLEDENRDIHKAARDNDLSKCEKCGSFTAGMVCSNPRCGSTELDNDPRSPYGETLPEPPPQADPNRPISADNPPEEDLPPARGAENMPPAGGAGPKQSSLPDPTKIGDNLGKGAPTGKGGEGASGGDGDDNKNLADKAKSAVGGKAAEAIDGLDPTKEAIDKLPGGRLANQVKQLAAAAQAVVQAVTQAVNFIINMIVNPVFWVVTAVFAIIFVLILGGITSFQVFGPNPYACKSAEECEALQMCEVVEVAPVGGSIDPSYTLGTDPKTRRVTLMRELIARWGITPEQAAGVIGNFMVEAGAKLNPARAEGEADTALPPPSSGGYGWAQWTDRRETFVAFGVDRGYVPNKNTPFTDAANLAFLLFEISGTEARSLPALKQTRTAADAADSWRINFERPGVPAIAERRAGAKQALQEYNSGGGSSGTTSVSTGGASGTWAPPVKKPFNISAHFPTYPGGLKSHTGVDFAAPRGDPVYAVGGGTAKPAPTSWGGPHGVMIDHGNGYWTFYAHMDSTIVKDTMQVSTGQKIGTVGTLGNSTGYHLHLELGKNGSSPGGGSNLDPEDYFPFFNGVPEGKLPPPVGGAAVGSEQNVCAEEEPGELGGTCEGVPTPFTGTVAKSGSPMAPQTEHGKTQMETNCGSTLNGALGGACNRDTVNRGTDSGHYWGVSCDIFPKGSASNKNNCAQPSSEGCTNGTKLKNWLVQYGPQLKVQYVIWDGKIYSAGHGWRERYYSGCGPTVCNGSATALHQDHVHVSFQPGP